jgi:hypothetical protein
MGQEGSKPKALTRTSPSETKVKYWNFDLKNPNVPNQKQTACIEIRIMWYDSIINWENLSYLDDDFFNKFDLINHHNRIVLFNQERKKYERDTNGPVWRVLNTYHYLTFPHLGSLSANESSPNKTVPVVHIYFPIKDVFKYLDETQSDNVGKLTNLEYTQRTAVTYHIYEETTIAQLERFFGPAMDCQTTSFSQTTIFVYDLRYTDNTPGLFEFKKQLIADKINILFRNNNQKPVNLLFAAYVTSFSGPLDNAEFLNNVTFQNTSLTVDAIERFLDKITRPITITAKLSGGDVTIKKDFMAKSINNLFNTPGTVTSLTFAMGVTMFDVPLDNSKFIGLKSVTFNNASITVNKIETFLTNDNATVTAKLSGGSVTINKNIMAMNVNTLFNTPGTVTSLTFTAGVTKFDVPLDNSKFIGLQSVTFNNTSITVNKIETFLTNDNATLKTVTAKLPNSVTITKNVMVKSINTLFATPGEVTSLTLGPSVDIFVDVTPQLEAKFSNEDLEVIFENPLTTNDQMDYFIRLTKFRFSTSLIITNQVDADNINNAPNKTRITSIVFETEVKTIPDLSAFTSLNEYTVIHTTATLNITNVTNEWFNKIVYGHNIRTIHVTVATGDSILDESKFTHLDLIVNFTNNALDIIQTFLWQYTTYKNQTITSTEKIAYIATGTITNILVANNLDGIFNTNVKTEFTFSSMLNWVDIKKTPHNSFTIVTVNNIMNFDFTTTTTNTVSNASSRLKPGVVATINFIGLAEIYILSPRVSTGSTTGPYNLKNFIAAYLDVYKDKFSALTIVNANINPNASSITTNKDMIQELNTDATIEKLIEFNDGKVKNY